MDKIKGYPTEKRAPSPRLYARLAAGGFAAGVVNGIFGNGGGVVIVFLLSGASASLFSDERKVFSNVTAAVLPIATTSALIYSSVSPPGYADVIGVAAASLAGGAIGAMLLGKIRVRALKVIFALIMIVSGIVMIAGRR